MARIFQRKPNGPYWIDFFVDGQRIRESTGTTNRQLAEKCLRSRLGDVVQNRFKLEDRKPAPTLSEFSEHYLAWSKENKKSCDRDFYSVQNLLPFFGNKRLNTVHPLDVESYKIARKKDVKPATINREVACLKRILNMAIEWQVIKENPIAKVKLYRESIGSTRFLSQEEAQRLIDACSGCFKWIVVTAVHTGMRKNELLTLKWSDIDLNSGYLTLRETKNGEVRNIPMDNTIRQLFKTIPRRSDFVFTQENGQPYRWIGRAWRNALKEVQFRCRFHDLRHTFASHLAMKGVDLRTIMELMGHKSLKMVLRYSHLSSDHLKQAVARLDGVMGGDGTNMAQEGRIIEFSKEVSNY